MKRWTEEGVRQKLIPLLWPVHCPFIREGAETREDREMRTIKMKNDAENHEQGSERATWCFRQTFRKVGALPLHLFFISKMPKMETVSQKEGE